MAEARSLPPTDTQVPRHRPALSARRAQTFTHIPRTLLSPPAQPASQSWRPIWGQQARYRPDSEGSQTDNYTVCPGHPAEHTCAGRHPKEGWEPTRWGEAVLLGSRRLEHFYKEKVKGHRAALWGRHYRGSRPGGRGRGKRGVRRAEGSINQGLTWQRYRGGPGCPTCSERGLGRGGSGVR